MSTCGERSLPIWLRAERAGRSASGQRGHIDSSLAHLRYTGVGSGGRGKRSVASMSSRADTIRSISAETSSAIPRCVVNPSTAADPAWRRSRLSRIV